MLLETINLAIDDISKKVENELWFDFDIMNFDGRTLLITGTIDRTYPHTLEISFEDVFAFFSLTEWTWSRKESPIILEVLDDNLERRDIIDKYSVEAGHEVFKIYTESLSIVNIIIAKSLYYKEISNCKI